MSQMVAVPRLAALALVACILFAPPASAEEGPEPAPSGGGSGGCGNGAGNCTGSGNSTTQPPGPEPAPAPPAPAEVLVVEAAKQVNSVFSATPAGPCDLVRPTGDRPRASVNPVLGLVTVNPGCILRSVRAVDIEHFDPAQINPNLAIVPKPEQFSPLFPPNLTP